MEGETSAAKVAYLQAQTRFLTLQADISEDAWKWEQAKNARRVYNIIGGIDDAEAYNYRTTLARWLDYDPNSKIVVVINSQGGSVFSGFGIYDFTEGIIAEGADISTKCIGYAASMAGILLQMGSIRIMTPNSHMMIHEAQTLLHGSQSAALLRDQTELIEKLQDRCLTLLAARSTLTTDEINRRSDRRNWWLNADEALECGFIDKVEL